MKKINRKYKDHLLNNVNPLTGYAKDGECNCKADRACLLSRTISGIPKTERNNIILDLYTFDDASVLTVIPRRYAVTSFNYQTPVADNPFVDEGDPTPKEMVDGIKSKWEEARVIITGEHTINAPVPLLGLSAIDETSQRCIKTNKGA